VPKQKVRLLIVDDSVFTRATLKKILSRDPGIEIVDEARDGREGILKLQQHKPDVVTMDVEMPVMNGLQALEEIMRLQPTPVIVLSSVTTTGARLTMNAFELGAADVVAKPSGKSGDGLAELTQDLIMKIKAAAEIDPRRLRGSFPRPASIAGGLAGTARRAEAAGSGARVPGATPRQRVELVAIGTSTGGPRALQMVLQELPADLPVPVVVAQHMPNGFTELLAKRLDGICPLAIREVEDGEVLKNGTVYIAQSGKQIQVTKKGTSYVAQIGDEMPIKTLYKPSVDIMFLSLAKGAPPNAVLGVVMTGMGADGLRGAKEMKNKGSFLIAESEQTCIVYGMPRVIVEAGLADRVEDLPNIARAIMECVNANKR